MDSQANQPEFATWSAEGFPDRIEYSLIVLEELRAMAEEGFQKIPHGGIEVGAVLLGSREDGVVRIREWRPIHCDHARGPSFALSNPDLQALEQQMSRLAASPELAGLQPVGWFHTHTRSKIFLSADDLAIHERFFPEPWQIAMVLHPVKDQSATAGFFLRNSAGTLVSEASPSEFPVKPNPTLALRPRRASAPPREPTGPGPASGRPDTVLRRPEPFTRSERPMFKHGEPGPGPAPASSPAIPRPALPPAEPPPAWAAEPYAPVTAAGPSDLVARSAATLARFPRAAMWAALVLFGVVGVGLAANFWWIGRLNSTASLRIEEGDRSLLVGWDNMAPAVQNADRGLLRIVDGAVIRTVPLNAAAVHNGAVTYMRQSEDVEVRLTLFQDGKPILQEFSRFVGAPVNAKAGARMTPDQQKVRLQADVARLREALREESQRAARLREELTLLEQRATAGGSAQPR